MNQLPQDPFMLLSAVNMMLRDGDFESLEDLCAYYDADLPQLCGQLRAAGYVYDEAQRRFRPL
ncbi:MAG: DUF4250 domain-containing protein [Paludibacteraceae bacterium]|nr:DUF4250 domain-containing protein [Paludibacteraceae bacterium]